jgi:hypothetical protein
VSPAATEFSGVAVGPTLGPILVHWRSSLSARCIQYKTRASLLAKRASSRKPLDRREFPGARSIAALRE